MLEMPGDFFDVAVSCQGFQEVSVFTKVKESLDALIALPYSVLPCQIDTARDRCVFDLNYLWGEGPKNIECTFESCSIVGFVLTLN